MRAPYGRGRRFRQSQIADLSRPHQFRHSANRFFDRHLRIDAMLVVQIDGSYPQTLQAPLAAGLHVFRPAIDAPHRRVRLVAHNSELGGEKNLFAHAANRLANKHFVVAIAVNVRGVQKRDAQLNRTMNRSRRFRIVPRSIKFGHPHTAQTQGGNKRAVLSQWT